MTATETGMLDWDALQGAVAACVSAGEIPGYRRAWFQSLIRQGREAEDAGRAALAVHCRERANKELAGFSTVAAATRVLRSMKVSGGTMAPGTAEQAGDAAHSVAAALSPLAALAARQGSAARARLLELLERHAGRLSPGEIASFRAGLEGAATMPVSAISELRRRLVDRLLRSARYRRQGARLSAWRPLAMPENTPPAGPYNDYRTLEDTLQRVAALHPEWAAEFFDVYATMRGVRKIYGEFLPGK
jgi:hypothetical protein